MLLSKIMAESSKAVNVKDLGGREEKGGQTCQETCDRTVILDNFRVITSLCETKELPEFLQQTR